jgi:hypothetical protein
MTHIYKCGHLDINNQLVKLFVFFGSTTTTLNELFVAEPENSIFDGVFSPEEKHSIVEKSIPVVFIDDYIHLDDTIETIKKKIIRHTQLNTSFDELYLFAKKYEMLNSIATYQMLTQNEKLSLTKERLIQFLLNIDEINIADIVDKEIYTYEDILLLGLENKQLLVNTPIGQTFVAIHSQFPYTVNPFNVLVYDAFLEQHAEDITSTTNTSILMNSVPIYNNMIYICTTASVLRNAMDNNLSQESSIKIYFPYLFKKGIINEELLDKNKQQLLAESEEMAHNKVFERNTSNVNLFYNLYYKRASEITYNEVGIQQVEFIIHPNYSFNLPLDVVFKLIHATIQVPFIKYNPAKRQEKIYRLYADRIAKNGKKIPYLNKSEIFKLMKSISIGKNKYVTAYIEHFIGTEKETGTPTPITCEFSNNGDITIKASFAKGLSIESINKELALAVNPVINVVKDYLIQSGYSMNNFINLNFPHIEIVNMDYIIYAPIKKQMKLKEIIGCLSSIFNVISDDINKVTTMRFKRVANYNEMDSQEAFIIELINEGAMRNEEIIKALAVNFQMSEEKARNKIADFISTFELQSTIQNKKLKIKNNPGFLTTMIKDKFDNMLNITISGINDIRYLDTLPIYIDSILRITQEPDKSSIGEINKLCKKTKINDKEEVHIKDIQATAIERGEGAAAASEREAASEIEAAEASEIEAAISFKLPTTAVEEEGEGEELTGLDMLLFGMNEEEEEEESQEGGATPEPEEEEEEEEEETDGDLLKTDLTGQSLSNTNNPVFKRLKNKDPVLFLTKQEGKFKSYSRSCPSQYKRQPVILTDEEKKNIDEKHPGSYDQAVQYGSNPDKKFWYICPRYWSLKDNVSLTEEEAKSGKYGSIIPANAKKIPPGGNIYEFREDRFHGTDEKYIQHYPGFLKQDSHPQGKCIPCCFKSWNSKKQKTMRDICAADEPVKATPQKTDVANDYIKGAEKFPLDQNRYGYLPISIQNFISTDNKKCQISAINSSLKPNHPCFIRHGVEASKLQSFVACIADVWVDIVGGQVLSIKEIKEVFIKALTLDNFMMLQNGNLVDIFAREAAPSASAAAPSASAAAPSASAAQEEVDIETYSTTLLYKNTTKSNPYLLTKVIKSMNNFINYLRDNNVEINHTYLWDLICIPNPKLFNDGLNMVILEIVNNDITNNVQVLCPSNHYSSHFFDVNKKSILLMKMDDYYEPIYIFEDKVNEFVVTRRFSLKNANLLPNIKRTLDLIKNSMSNKCRPFSSMPTIYKFEKNILLETLIQLLQSKDYTIDSQVMNYNGKIIGVLASKNININNINTQTTRGFIPCFPSAPASTIMKSTWMDDDYGNDYKTTLSFLTNVYTDTKGTIPCKPVIKVLEDDLIVGILTQTNQFVVLSEPAEDIYGDDLEKVTDVNFIFADKQSLTDMTIDTERVDYIHKIRLESSFYNVFRNTLRFLMGEFRYRNQRTAIEKLITSPTLLYLNKLEQVIAQLKDLMKDHVEFSEYSPDILAELGAITNCYMANSECPNKKFCLTKDNDENNTCSLVIPVNNLISDKNNKTLYFGRMADELIRYNRIRSFMFQPKSFLAFSGLKYNLKEDEIILLQSLLTQEYFEDLVPAPLNKYVKYNTYDTTQPIKSQVYSNAADFISASAQVQAQVQVQSQSTSSATELPDLIECNQTFENSVTGYWSTFFSDKYSEIIFSNEPELCSFDIILTLIKDNNATRDITLNKYQLKEILVEEYQRYLDTYTHEILQILQSQGKSEMTKMVFSGQSTLANIIMSYDYYATNLDLWILAVKYNVPLVFLSVTKLIENGLPFLVAHHDGSNAFYFVKSPSSRIQGVPTYKLIVETDGAYKIPLDGVKAKLQKNVKETMTSDTLLEFIKTFSLEEANKRLKSEKTLATKLGKKLKLVVST